MSVKKSKKSSWPYDGIAFRQRAGTGSPRLVMFTAPIKEITKWAKVEPLGPTSKGHQREVKDARVTAIQRFLDADEINVIPTALVIAFPAEVLKLTKAADTPADSVRRTLTIAPLSKDKMGAIIDGQHRLRGIEAYDANIRIPIVGIVDADAVERAFQFLVINNKSTRVAATHTKALLAKMAHTSLLGRLKGARLAFDANGIRDVDLVNSDKESPFFESIAWTVTPEGKRIIQATAIENSLEYLGGLGISEFEDRDVRRSVFLAMWSEIKDHWQALWKKDSRLISKVGIICLTRFISDRITAWADSDEIDIDLSDLKEIRDHTKKIIQNMDKRFWTTPWAEGAQGGFDTKQGRDRVYAAIQSLFRNGKKGIDWRTDIDILGTPSPE